jgi:transposase InsO family protein
MRRYREEGEAGLQDRSRRPHNSPNQTPEEVEERVVELRNEEPTWGGRKIHRVLKERGMLRVPPPSTITEILRRHSLIDPEESRKRGPWQRFEAEAPNDLWQMDFKGHFPLANAVRCHPLTLLDDHSRYCLGLRACGNERRETVREQLSGVFRHYGLPRQLLVDNGPPWGTEQRRRLTRLGAWLVRLGIEVIHTSHYHPQTIGKDERFHRTLKEDLLRRQILENLPHAQKQFDSYRKKYNHVRPHEALGLDVPASRYAESSRSFPETLPPLRYRSDDLVRKVQTGGRISFQNKLFQVGKALQGENVAVRPTQRDGIFEVLYCHHVVETIDFRDPS